MADVTMAPPADTPNGKTTPDTADKAPKSRPEKPDEEKYKGDLSKAEKEHAVAQEKLVRLLRVVTLSSLIVSQPSLVQWNMYT